MSSAVPSRSSFVHHPLALLAASLAAGILLAHLIAVPLSMCLVCGAVFSVAALWNFQRRRLAHASLLIAIAFFWAGATLALTEQRGVVTDRVQRFYDDGRLAAGDPVEVTGVLLGEPEPAPESFYLTLRVENLRFKEVEQEASGVVWLFAPVRDATQLREYEALELRYGARVRVMTELNRAESFRNPGVSSFTEYLERRRLDAVGTIKSPLLVERLDDERVFLPLFWVYEWRQRLLALIDRTFSIETACVLKASLLGNRYQLSRASAERFREGGTFHILVISGQHISFIGLIALFVASRVTRRRAWQFALSVTLLWAYTLAVGAESSVVRAALMFTLAAYAPVLHRRAGSLNALGGATLVLLVWRPSDLFDPSFQLTFLSVLMIVALAWPLLRRLKEVGEWHPASVSPYPPVCPRWWRTLGETLFWSEKAWQLEMARSVWSCRLFKTPLAARVERWRVQPLLRYGVGATVVSLSVQAGLLPLLVLYFHRVSFASLVLNIGVGVLMAVLSLVALAALLVSQLSAMLAAPLNHLAEMTNWLMVHSVDPFRAARLASMRLPEYTGWPAAIYVLYYVPLAVLILALARWRPLRPQEAYLTSESESVMVRLALRLAGLALVVSLVIIVGHPWSAPKPDGRLRVDFLDVGQGDAALVTMPDGATLLIDGGGRPNFRRSGYVDEDALDEPFERDARSIGERVVSEYLWWRGLDHVDYILATHADADHIDGLNDVARNFSVRAALVARAPRSDPEYARFAQTAREQGVPIYQLGRGDALRFGNVEGVVLWPARTADVNAPSRNNDSLVLRLTFNDQTFLFTGDIEKSAEAALTATPEDLRCNVVKVAHHGSKTSSTQGFVQATHASTAIISVGLTSIFGHPHKEILERWRANGAQLLTTGQSGTITISTDGHDLKVETFVKQ
jgi:competence protein ComEC